MNITLEVLAHSFTTGGELLLAVTILTVHDKLSKHHKIDKSVAKEITFEKIIGILAIFFIVIGYLMHVRVIGL